MQKAIRVIGLVLILFSTVANADNSWTWFCLAPNKVATGTTTKLTPPWKWVSNVRPQNKLASYNYVAAYIDNVTTPGKLSVKMYCGATDNNNNVMIKVEASSTSKNLKCTLSGKPVPIGGGKRTLCESVNKTFCELNCKP